MNRVSNSSADTTQTDRVTPNPADYLDRVADLIAHRIRVRGVLSVDELADLAETLGCSASDLLPPHGQAVTSQLVEREPIWNDACQLGLAWCVGETEVGAGWARHDGEQQAFTVPPTKWDTGLQLTNCRPMQYRRDDGTECAPLVVEFFMNDGPMLSSGGLRAFAVWLNDQADALDVEGAR